MRTVETKSLTLYAYSGWSVRPIGSTTASNAKDDCRSAAAADDSLDAVRAIDADGHCVVSIDRDDDGQLSDLSDLTV